MSTPITAITTNSSTSVNAVRRNLEFLQGLPKPRATKTLSGCRLAAMVASQRTNYALAATGAGARFTMVTSFPS